MKNLVKFINIENLKNNLAILKSKNKNSTICGVLKSDAYGHGLTIVGNALKSNLNYFAVWDEKEAKMLRKWAKTPILILSPPTKQSIIFSIKSNVELLISSREDFELIRQVTKNSKQKCFVHLKLNTGMNRLGFNSSFEICELKNEIEKSKNLKLKGVLTHIGGGSKKRTKKQLLLFEKWTKHLPQNILRHFANTDTLSEISLKSNEMARVGLGLYGYGPFKNLKPVMSIYAKVLNVLDVKKGEYVGYGIKHKAKKNMKIAVLSIGYFNGLMKNYSKKGFVLLKDKKAPFVAEICMNMSIVDITKQKDVKIGDFAVILGQSEHYTITAEQIAKKCNTSCYEILTNFRGIEVTKTKPKT